MRRAKRIVLIAGVLVVAASTADARIWGRKADKPAAAAAAEATIALSAVEIDGSRVILRTNGAPAYTSYSPSPGVFVVDLTDTARDAAVSIPSTLPPAVLSLAADEVVEMGSRLTRVTFRLTESLRPEVSAIEKAVVVTVPASAIPIETVEIPADIPVIETGNVPAGDAPAVTVVSEVPAQPVEVPLAEVPAEVVEEPVPVAAAPAARTEEVPLPRARTLRRIDATTNGGNVEVRITGDGQLKYKAFRLEAPSRLVIDVEGVKNAAAKTSVKVDDEVVRGVRVAQFQPTVARVVVDLAHKTEYDIAAVGEELRIAFGATARASLAPASLTSATIEAPSPRVQPLQVAETPAPPPVQTVSTRSEPPAARVDVVAQKSQPAADITDSIPTVVPAAAVQAPSWSVPETRSYPEPVSKGARSRITPAVDQAPPATQDDVFANVQPPATPTTAAQTLTGGRQIGGTTRVFNGEPLSLNLKDADIKDVLRTFAELTGLNMAIDPNVNGSVTVDFVDVPWDQALDLILRQNGLTWTLEGNVMRIGTVERIAAETAAARRLEEEQRLNVTLTTLSFKLSYARAIEVASLLRDIASPRARIITDPRTNQLIVSEIPEVLRTMQNLITTIDIPARQVMIEARIVESLRTFTQTWGFEWGFGGELNPALGTGTGLVFPNRVGFEGGPFEFGGGTNIISLSFMDVLGTFDLDLALSASEVQGFSKVVSAPRVTTQDNTAAEIQSGFQIPYQTRINFTTTVTYLDATLRLTVTPQITAAGTVIMEIAVQKNEPATGLSIAGAAGTPLTTRQARTRLMVRDGGTAVIAGIFQTRDNQGQTRIPFVHQIPIIGALFRSHSIDTSHDELLIFITPRIVRS